MKNSLGLSVIVITRNEEESLPSCLESIKRIADEIILVDSGSTDKTLSIAKSYPVQIFHRDWTGYSAQKQFALEKASGPWVLNIDADERITPQLAQEIQETLSNQPIELKPNGFDIPFQHFFCGTRLRFGGVQGESHVRLFRKDHSRYGQETIHEGILVNPPVGHLSHPILHNSYKDIHDYLTKCNDYTTMIAREKYLKGARFHSWHHLRLPWEFLVRYIFKLGFLDRREGLTYALLSSYYGWLKYAKLLDEENNGK